MEFIRIAILTITLVLYSFAVAEENEVRFSNCAVGGYDPNEEEIKQRCNNFKDQEFYYMPSNEVIVCNPMKFYEKPIDGLPPLTLDNYEKLSKVVDNICKKNKKRGAIVSVPGSSEEYSCTYQKFKCEISEKEENRFLKNKNIENSGVQSEFDLAKNKCLELGFKPNTSKFGKCVLELTK